MRYLKLNMLNKFGMHIKILDIIGFHGLQQWHILLNCFGVPFVKCKGLTVVFFSALIYDSCAPLSHLSSYMPVDHGPSQQITKEYKL